MDTTTQSIDLTDRPADTLLESDLVEPILVDTTFGDTTLGDTTLVDTTLTHTTSAHTTSADTAVTETAATGAPAVAPAVPTWVIPVDEIAKLLEAQPPADLTPDPAPAPRLSHRWRTSAAVGALIIGALIIGPPVFGRHGASQSGAAHGAPVVSISSVTFGNDDAVVMAAPAQP